MNETLMYALGYTGAFSAIAFAGFGSALGTGAAGASAIGAWKKCYAQNKPAPFQLVILAGAPLSQTIYGMVVMFLALNFFIQPEQWPFFLMLGIFAGVAMGASAWMQGKAAAGACDAFAETEKGFTNFLMILGVIETVAIFIMAFAIVIMAMRGGNFKPKAPGVNSAPAPIEQSAVVKQKSGIREGGVRRWIQMQARCLRSGMQEKRKGGHYWSDAEINS